MPNIDTTANVHKDKLVSLIISLNRAEKRNFKVLYATKDLKKQKLFVRLFDFLEKKEFYNVREILKAIPEIKATQLANVKMNLYKQLMSSLRNLHRKNNIDIEIREQLDFARILYNKGLYRQALEVLEKSKKRGMKLHLYPVCMEILEFEKLIESQHITGSMHMKAEELSKQSLSLSATIRKTARYSNLSLQLYGLYLKFGYVRNDQDYELVSNFFRKNLPKIKYDLLGFFEKLYLNQAHVWYCTMVQNFPFQYKYSKRWLDLFHQNPIMIKEWTPLYLKGFHNLLNSLFMNANYPKFILVLQQMEDFINEHSKTFNQNVQSLSLLFLYIHKINKHFLDGSFKDGVKLIPELEANITDKYLNWDNHRKMVFHYKIACLYFGAGENEKTIDTLNKIIFQYKADFRVDIQCFSRILSLLAHLELENEMLVSYQIKSVYRFLGKMDDIQEVHKEIFKFIRKTTSINRSQMKLELISLRDRLQDLQKEPYQRRPFFYLDIISWLDGKIQNKSTAKVIEEKFKISQAN